MALQASCSWVPPSWLPSRLPDPRSLHPNFPPCFLLPGPYAPTSVNDGFWSGSTSQVDPFFPESLLVLVIITVTGKQTRTRCKGSDKCSKHGDARLHSEPLHGRVTSSIQHIPASPPPSKNRVSRVEDEFQMSYSNEKLSSEQCELPLMFKMHTFARFLKTYCFFCFEKYTLFFYANHILWLLF